MANCETITLCPDLEIADAPLLSEPLEVGPFREGRLFVKLRNVDERASVSVDIGISPTGYEDWDRHWSVLETANGLGEATMYSYPISNFGNWLRLRIRSSNGTETDCRIQAWFVGK
jgi:hypothetical protein